MENRGIPVSNSSVKFIQISDLHLGSRVLPRCFAATSEVRLKREEEILEALESLIAIFAEEKAELLLVAGDLFDNDLVAPELVNRVFAIFSRLPFTCILPGNHDYLSGASPYSEYERARRGLESIPDNVHIFNGTDYSSVYLPGRGDVSVTGRPFTGNTAVTEHLLAQRIPRDPAEITLLLHHGARTQFTFEEMMKITAPFTAAELLAQGFSYTALGHYHSFSALESAEGLIKAAYAGRPFACEFRAKNGCILIGTATASGVEELIQYDIDFRKIFDLEIYCDNAGSNAELLDLVRVECGKNNVHRDDIVRFRFTGTRKSDFMPELLLPREELFAFIPDFSELHLGYDTARLLEEAEGKAATVESLFLREIHSQLAEEPDFESRVVLLDALDYGMKALRGIRVIPRDISEEEEV